MTNNTPADIIEHMANKDTIVRDFDPNFAIPIGLKNATSTESSNADENAASDDYNDKTENTVDVVVEEFYDEDAIAEDTYEDAPEAPDSITIISQTIRTAPDGTQVVDVVLEVDDDGTTNYNVRKTAT